MRQNLPPEKPNQRLYDLLGGLYKYVKVLVRSHYAALTPEQKKFIKCPPDFDDELLDEEWKNPVPSPVNTPAASDDDDEAADDDNGYNEEDAEMEEADAE
ncbi:hypothetical protein GP486_008095 [Trichoglossum hirsutum]|uniref:Uncharacterized protein n=1 Tax=Trichoglossum hirsutum TaxID=265104 RepID=A0A9P8L6I5_9PEZI|nr:hypothetical protein GP486_008095 [Trichoglossum hirsutum]